MDANGNAVALWAVSYQNPNDTGLFIPDDTEYPYSQVESSSNLPTDSSVSTIGYVDGQGWLSNSTVQHWQGTFLSGLLGLVMDQNDSATAYWTAYGETQHNESGILSWSADGGTNYASTISLGGQGSDPPVISRQTF